MFAGPTHGFHLFATLLPIFRIHIFYLATEFRRGVSSNKPSDAHCCLFHSNRCRNVYGLRLKFDSVAAMKQMPTIWPSPVHALLYVFVSVKCKDNGRSRIDRSLNNNSIVVSVVHRGKKNHKIQTVFAEMRRKMKCVLRCDRSASSERARVCVCLYAADTRQPAMIIGRNAKPLLIG